MPTTTITSSATALPTCEAPMTDTMSRVVKSPIGDLTLVATEKGLVSILFPGDAPPASDPVEMDDAPKVSEMLTEASRQLDEYFAQERTEFDLVLSPSGTEFQLAAWDALCNIPYGHTWTYGKQAEFMSRPKAVRAVGAANGRNPLPIVIPCHRVIGANGSLTGFAGGIESKAILLDLESSEPTLLSASLGR